MPKTISWKFGIPYVFGQRVPDSRASSGKSPTVVVTEPMIPWDGDLVPAGRRWTLVENIVRHWWAVIHEVLRRWLCGHRYISIPSLYSTVQKHPTSVCMSCDRPWSNFPLGSLHLFLFCYGTMAVPSSCDKLPQICLPSLWVNVIMMEHHFEHSCVTIPVCHWP